MIHRDTLFAAITCCAALAASVGRPGQDENRDTVQTAWAQYLECVDESDPNRVVWHALATGRPARTIRRTRSGPRGLSISDA